MAAVRGAALIFETLEQSLMRLMYYRAGLKECLDRLGYRPVGRGCFAGGHALSNALPRVCSGVFGRVGGHAVAGVHAHPAQQGPLQP